jgi:hypothetical protein
VDLSKAFLTVGGSKSEAGEGRTVPLNSELLQALVDYSKWYTKRFGSANGRGRPFTLPGYARVIWPRQSTLSGPARLRSSPSCGRGGSAGRKTLG